MIAALALGLCVSIGLNVALGVSLLNAAADRRHLRRVNDDLLDRVQASSLSEYRSWRTPLAEIPPPEMDFDIAGTGLVVEPRE